MFGAYGDHSLIGDGYSGVGSKDLALLLFPCIEGKGEVQIDAGAGMETGHVVIQIRLADLRVGGEDVHDKGAEIDGIETFGGIVKNGVVDIVDCNRKLVVCDGEDHLVCVPCVWWHWWHAVPCVWLLWRWQG
jgi:hypothetical protein